MLETRGRTRRRLQREQGNDSQPVEAVVNRGSGERVLELRLVPKLSERDQRASQARANVRPHHHRDGHPHVEDCNDGALLSLLSRYEECSVNGACFKQRLWAKFKICDILRIPFSSRLVPQSVQRKRLLFYQTGHFNQKYQISPYIRQR